jgi:diguanylate cyclase (GGDEF)-like protein
MLAAMESELAALRQENETLRRAVELLHRVANLVREALALEPTCYAILTGVTAGVGLGMNRAMLFFIDDTDRDHLVGVAAVGPRDRQEADRVWRSIAAGDFDLRTLYEHGLQQLDNPGPLDQRVRVAKVLVGGDSPIALALRRRELVHGEGSDDVDGLFDLPTCVAAPLRGKGKLVGVLYADNRFTGRRIGSEAELVFSLLADHAGRAIDGARAYDQVAAQARTDALTGLGHHGTMRQALVEALDASDDRPLSLAMIDLDDFKQVNDRYGHLVGDALLAAVADRLRSQLRSGASVYRYGGEEFAVLLPGVVEQELPQVGERIRRALADKSFALGDERTMFVTCSVGLAHILPAHNSTDADTLIDRADQALLRAKRTGKNRVEIA